MPLKLSQSMPVTFTASCWFIKSGKFSPTSHCLRVSLCLSLFLLWCCPQSQASRLIQPPCCQKHQGTCQGHRGVQRRESKNKGKKEGYAHLKAEFQCGARRDKKALLSDQCKEIEGNNTIGKSRDLFKNIIDTKRIFHAKISTIKERNVMDLTETEDIEKRWQSFKELYEKIFLTQKIMMV